MVGHTQPITKTDSAHFERLKSKPCVCCLIEGIAQPNRTTAHHLLSGSRRRGHQASIPLCEWHHQGVPRQFFTSRLMTDTYGPSLARGSKLFHGRYGTDDELLAKSQGAI